MNFRKKLLEAMNEVSSLETQKVEIDANRKHILETTSQEDIEQKESKYEVYSSRCDYRL